MAGSFIGHTNGTSGSTAATGAVEWTATDRELCVSSPASPTAWVSLVRMITPLCLKRATAIWCGVTASAHRSRACGVIGIVLIATLGETTQTDAPHTYALSVRRDALS